MPNISETGTAKIFRMFVPLTKQTFVKCSESEVCFPETLLSNGSNVKNGKKKSWKNQVIVREALVDCGKKTRVLLLNFLLSSLWDYLLLQICKEDRKI